MSECDECGRRFTSERVEAMTVAQLLEAVGKVSEHDDEKEDLRRDLEYAHAENRRLKAAHDSIFRYISTFAAHAFAPGVQKQMLADLERDRPR
jgi:transcriptional regulator NrdR family protein